ncbi:MAG: PAS domain S-box protein, partial [Candidatus Accumulibacter sp.]|nr:PAS domain S-box protein [Accumulibacter sp.]
AERARAKGAPAATEPVTLVQETGNQASFLLMLPIYRNDARIATADERQDAFAGVVYAAFRMGDLARGVYGDDVDRLDMTVDDAGPVAGAAGEALPLLRLTPSPPRASSAPFRSEALLDFAGRRWRLRSTAVDAPTAVKRTATAVLAGGALISVLVFGLLQSFAGSRARALKLADGMTHELRESEAHTRAVLDNTLDAIITIDEQGLIESFNLAAEKLFRYGSEDVLGRNVKMLMPEPYAGEHDGYLSAYRRTGQRKIIGREREVVGKRADDSCFPMELAVTEVMVNDRRRFIGLMRDKTERKKMEQLKNEFVSTVSHELRTPLTSIRGSLGLLEGGLAGELPGQARSLIGIAASNCERLVVLINDILDMERMASDGMSFQSLTLPLMPLIEQAVEANQGFAVQHEVRFELVARLAEGSARIDPDRFLQVLANLLSNAAKFSPAGETVDVSLRRHGARLRVEVVDRGPGIPEDFRARIFEKFSQADASTTRARGGSGLGLSIARALVERMGGEIGFCSEPGRGSCFWFELPEVAAGAAPLEGGVTPGNETDGRSPAAVLRILHVEDDADLVRVVAAQFGSSAEIIEARTLSTAREAVAGKTFDVVILDIGLPDGSGLDLLPVIQGLARSPPVVVFSASDAESRLATEHEVAASLVKSRTSNERLVQIVRELAQPGA